MQDCNFLGQCYYKDESAGCKSRDACPHKKASIMQLNENELRADLTADIPLDELEALFAARREGRCVVLPCKAGDAVYVIPSEVNMRLNIATRLSANNGVYTQIIDSIRYFKASDWVIPTCDGLEIHRSDDFGKTVFLTRSAAEAALKEVTPCESPQ